MGESVVILENKCGMRTQCRVGRVPVDRRVRKFNIEIRDHGLTLYGHVSWRWKVRAFDVLQVVYQCLLGRTSLAGIPLDRSLVDHDSEGKSGMTLRRCHHQLRRLVDRIVRPIPVDDYAIDAAAHHVINLTLHLRRVRFTVANVHVARLAEP